MKYHCTAYAGRAGATIPIKPPQEIRFHETNPVKPPSVKMLQHSKL